MAKKPTRRPGARLPKPHIGWEVLHARYTETPRSPEDHANLIRAINEKRLISFLPLGSADTVVAEPHVYGVVDGIPTCVMYVPSTPRDPWLAMPVREMVMLLVQQETFPGKRPLPPEFDPDIPPPEDSVSDETSS